MEDGGRVEECLRGMDVVVLATVCDLKLRSIAGNSYKKTLNNKTMEVETTHTRTLGSDVKGSGGMPLLQRFALVLDEVGGQRLVTHLTVDSDKTL